MQNTTQELTQTDDIACSQRNILRFLVLNDCKHGSLHTLKALSLLIAKKTHETLGELKAEYSLLGGAPDTVRFKLIYCIRHNYDALRAAVQRTYCYDIGKFYGIKGFIDQMSFVFDSFARK
ncbi:MAG: hypothetical protein HFE46_07305 [Clostridia bacterium]|nr:hypothetical protein [Clostridia bacterium]